MLELKHVTKCFGSFKALDDLTMTVPKGAVYGLVGPNGAGKTTAIRLMLGVYYPESGTLTMEGQPVFDKAKNNMYSLKILQVMMWVQIRRTL